MSAFQSDVYQAFRSMDVPEDKALKAAEALSKRDNEVNTIARKVDVLTWICGAQFAMVAALFLKAFAPF